MQNALPQHAKDKAIELWFHVWTARVGQKGTLTYIGARTGSRPRIPHDLRYECAYVLGAVCPARDTGAALVLPDADIPAMNLHLGAISAHVKKDSHAAIIIDGPGWHKEGGKLWVPDNMTLIRLPSYSPELTPRKISGNIFVPIIWPAKSSTLMMPSSMAVAPLGMHLSPHPAK